MISGKDLRSWGSPFLSRRRDLLTDPAPGGTLATETCGSVPSKGRAKMTAGTIPGQNPKSLAGLRVLRLFSGHRATTFQRLRPKRWILPSFCRVESVLLTRPRVTSVSSPCNSMAAFP